MARVNIEEQWWSDPRRSLLIKKVGDEEMADGIAIKMWRLAQEFWKNNKEYIPLHIFETLRNYQDLLGCGLALLGDDGVYVRGSSQYFDWCLEVKKKGQKGGQISAQRPRDAKGRLLKGETNDPSCVQAESKQIQASGSYSSSGSLSDSNSLNTITPENKNSKLKQNFDFESVYTLYPRKEGKAEGMARLPKLIKTQDEFDNFTIAVKNYTEKNKTTEVDKIKFWSSFIGTEKCQPWRDYINFDSGKKEDYISRRLREIEEEEKAAAASEALV